MDGQSFAIGGLIKNNTTTNIKAFPVPRRAAGGGCAVSQHAVPDRPFGAVFVITPRLVKPLPPGYKLPTDGYVPPTRSELILGGKLEGTRRDEPLTAEPVPPQSGGFDKEKK
jgi:pilus assembly protein CpaC